MLEGFSVDKNSPKTDVDTAHRACYNLHIKTTKRNLEMAKKQEFSPEFELWVAEFYKGKMASAKHRGLEFKLNLISFRNLLRTQKCPYTGIALTVPRKNPLHSDITIDRIDNKKGYVPGNVMAISRIANNFKSMFEGDSYPLTMNVCERMLRKMQKKLNETKETK